MCISATNASHSLFLSNELFRDHSFVVRLSASAQVNLQFLIGLLIKLKIFISHFVLLASEFVITFSLDGARFDQHWYKSLQSISKSILTRVKRLDNSLLWRLCECGYYLYIYWQ